MIRLFIGWDHREAVGGHVFIQSLLETCSQPVSLTIITPEIAGHLAPTDGTNAFSKARFLVPFLCDFDGRAIWLDGADMLLRGDLTELWNQPEGFAVRVVKHAYQTQHPRKYIGTELEAANADYPRKNWSSVIVWENFAHTKLTPDFIQRKPGSYLHRFEWLSDEAIGDLPASWNHLVREYQPNPKANLAHYTLGIPSFIEYQRDEHSDKWRATLQRSRKGIQSLQGG